MFEQRPEYKVMVDAVYAIAVTRKRGEFITHEEVTEVFGVGPNEKFYVHLMNKVRHRLEKHKFISTMSLRDVGYKLCTVEEQLKLGPWRIRRARKQIRRGEASIKALGHVKSLSINQRNRQALTLTSLETHRRELAVSERVATLVSKPTAVNPRRVIVPREEPKPQLPPTYDNNELRAD